MSDNGRYVTTSIFCPTDTTQHMYRSYVKVINRDTRKNSKTSTCLMCDYKRSFSIRRARFQVEIWRVQVSITRVRIGCRNVPAANQPNRKDVPSLFSSLAEHKFLGKFGKLTIFGPPTIVTCRTAVTAFANGKG